MRDSLYGFDELIANHNQTLGLWIMLGLGILVLVLGIIIKIKNH